jgi:O-antigen/teichoic acid export membrane protein
MLDTRAEIIILSLYFSEASVGYYSAVNTVLGGVTLFSEGIRNAVFPIVIRFQQTSSEKLKEVVFLLGKYILIISLPISIIVYYYSNEILTFFFGKGFEVSFVMLKITIWLFVSYSLTVVLSGLLMAHNEERSVAISLLISSLLTIILNIILAPNIGITGVAIVRVFTSIIMFCICLYFHYKKTGYGIVKNSIGLRILVASLCMFFLIQLILSFNKYLATIFGLLIFVILLLLFRVLKIEDLVMWQSVIKELIPKSQQNHRP